MGFHPPSGGGGGGGAPTNASYVVMGLDATLANERVLTGTANQIIVTDGGAGGNVTLSTPQDIATTSNPSFSSVTLSQAGGLHLLDSDSSHDLVLIAGSNLTADRNLTLTTGDAARTVTVSGDTTISQDYSTTGAPQFARLGIGAAAGAGANTLIVTQAVATSGSPAAVLLTAGAHTTLATATEAADINLNLARTVEFTAGNFALQRAVRIQGPTYAATAATVITRAVTLDVAEPVAGTNMTFTNTYAARFNGTIEINKAAEDQIIFAAGLNNLAILSAKGSNIAIMCEGNRTATAGGADFYVRSQVRRTNGNLVQFENLDGAGQPDTTYAFSVLGGIGIIQQAATVGTPDAQTTQVFKVTTANHTKQVASTEISNFVIPSYNRQWNTGAITTQREFFLGRPTYSFVGASTITTAATFAVENSPAAGTNATITNTYSVWIQAGISRFDGRVLNVAGANVVAANDLTLGQDGNTFTITGNTQINAITTTRWAAGSYVTLLFTGTPTVKHNTAGGAGTAVLFLAGSADFTAANNSVLGLFFDGTQWQETFRKVA